MLSLSARVRMHALNGVELPPACHSGQDHCGSATPCRARCSRNKRVKRVLGDPLKYTFGRVRHSVAIYGQLLLFCDQSMRETAWRRRTLLAGAAGEQAGATRLRQARPSSACTFSDTGPQLRVLAGQHHERSGAAQ